MSSSFINSIPVICIIAASYVTLIAAARNGVCPDPATGETKRYNVNSEVCCSGNIYPVGRGARPLCCGEGIYNPRDEICCGGEVKRRSEGEQCCAFSDWYNPDNSICCGNHVHSRNGGFECCGSAKYDTSVETCCEVEEEDGDITMATLPGVGQCCGNTVIDTSHEICCNGVAHVKRDSWTKCCGNSTYNPMTEMCCDNHQPYNPYSQLCCDGNVHSSDNGAKCCGSESYLTSQSSCCNNNLFRGIPEMPNVQGCCGDVSFFKTNKICCQDTLYKRGEDVACCGHDTYNSSTELCCGHADESLAILEKASPSQECCGLSTYDPTSQTCCEMASQSFDGIIGGECCGTDPHHVRAYDPERATCCRGSEGEFLYNSIPTGQAECCDSSILTENELCDPWSKFPVEKNVGTDDAICSGVTYNSATQVCMEDGVIEVLSRTLAVCGIQLYDPTAEVCCDDFIRGRFDEDGYERECCPGTTTSFKPALQTCCMATVHDIPSAESGCCRNTAYNTLTHMCDQRGIIRDLDEVAEFPELCGNTPYHPDEYVCCGDQLVGTGFICCSGYPVPLPEGSETGECCSFQAFDPVREVCCNGHVHMMTNSDATCCGYELLTRPESQICCDGSLHERDGGRDECHGRTAFNPETETVCNGWAFDLPNGECCSGQAYQPDDQICCKGELHMRKSEMTECCGFQIYETDNAMAICCNGHLSHGESDLQCCGDKTYDPLTETCCMNDLFPFTQSRMAEQTISCCDTATYQSSQHTCCGGVEHKFISGGECCGVDIVRNPEEEICCGGIVWSKSAGDNVECCGGELIDSRYQTCCNGVTLYPGEARECCGGTVINSFIHTCCGGEALLNDDQFECCDGSSFSTAEQGCCDTQIFNTSTEICSESNIVTALNPWSSSSNVADEADDGARVLFCDEQEYDALTQTCCGNFVFDLRDDFICCNGQPSDASSGKTSCCVDTPYNPTRFECCQGDLHHKVDGAQCCGASYYQPSKEICSDDHIVIPRKDTNPNTLPVSQDSQCLCNLNRRSDPISSACTDRLRFVQRIFIATVVDAEMLDGSRSYFIEPLEALRGTLPLVPEDGNGSIELVMSSQIGCNAPSLRRGQKIAVFIDSEMGLEESALHLTMNDVIIPYTRRLVRKLHSFL